MMLDIKSGRVFFLVNGKSKVNLLDKSLILLFGTIEDFKRRINRMFPSVINDKDGVLTVKTDNSILEFYYGSEEVIEKFVMVDVFLTEDPFKDVTNLCMENKWLLYDLEGEKYLDICY
jgi:hypothetical protein